MESKVNSVFHENSKTLKPSKLVQRHHWHSQLELPSTQFGSILSKSRKHLRLLVFKMTGFELGFRAFSSISTNACHILMGFVNH